MSNPVIESLQACLPDLALAQLALWRAEPRSEAVLDYAHHSGPQVGSPYPSAPSASASAPASTS